MKRIISVVAISMLSTQALLATPKKQISKKDETKKVVEGPAYRVALSTLEKTEQDVAKSIIKTTSILHRLEKALKIDKAYEKATSVPSAVYIGTGGIVLGGLVFMGAGKSIESTASVIESTGESFTDIRHTVPSVTGAFDRSGNAILASAEPVEAFGRTMYKFGSAWLDQSKLIVDNPSSRASGNAFITYIVKPAGVFLDWSLEQSGKLAEASYNGLTTVYRFLNGNILRFADDTARTLGQSSAGVTLSAAAGYLSYVAWNKAAPLYDKTIDLSDEEIASAVMSDSEINNGIEQIANSISELFDLTTDQKAELKEVIANDLIAQKIKEYRADLPLIDDNDAVLNPWAADSLAKARLAYKKTLEEKYSLSDEEIANLMKQFDQMSPKVHQLKSVDPSIGAYEILNTVAKVLDENQLASLAALKAAYDNEAALKAFAKDLKVNSTSEALDKVKQHIQMLELTRAYIDQVNAVEEYFEPEAVQEAQEFIAEINKIIETRKKAISVVEDFE